MKWRFIIIFSIILIVILVIIYLLLHTSTTNIEVGDIKFFSFSYSNGYHAYANTIYKLEYKNNKYIVSVKPDGSINEDTISYEVDKEFEEKLKDIIKRYNVPSWNGFNKSDNDVLDGNDFSIYVKFTNDTKIEANGYMKWPNNYREVKDELNKLFKGGNYEQKN